MTALPPTAESGDSFRERQLLCAAGLGAQEGVDKGRKGGVVTDQEKWKWNKAPGYLKRKFGLLEPLADGTTEKDTRLGDVGENWSAPCLKLFATTLNVLGCSKILSLCLQPQCFAGSCPHSSSLLVWLLLLKLCLAPFILALLSRVTVLTACCEWGALWSPYVWAEVQMSNWKLSYIPLSFNCLLCFLLGLSRGQIQL